MYRVSYRVYQRLVPCGKYIVVTSSHVNVSDHNLGHLYGTYGRIWVNKPICRPAITLQLLIVEVWLHIVFFHFKEPNLPLWVVNQNSAGFRSCKFRQMRQFYKKTAGPRGTFFTTHPTQRMFAFQQFFFEISLILLSTMHDSNKWHYYRNININKQLNNSKNI
jgi:hypothetical protein